MKEQILVIDFGSQYNQLIARRIREIGVFSELVDHTITAKEIRNRDNVVGIILSGGPQSVYSDDAYKLDQEIFELSVPVLGICYGMQYIASTFGGEVEKGISGEYGLKQIEVVNDTALTKNLPKFQNMWMSHQDHIVKLPEGFTKDAKTDKTPIVMISNTSKKIYGVQFHVEVNHSENGMEMLTNFVKEICQAKCTWTMANFVEESVIKIREQVGDEDVLCALSGGVDSSVVAALLHKAIGKQLTCLFVDHGLLRKNEGDNVMKIFSDQFHVDVVKINAKNVFLSKLKGVSDPETKRKIIGNEFIETFEREKKALKNAKNIKWLAQGTLYTDIVESGTKNAHTIKSHHNVGGLPEHMDFKLIEPVNMLFKDEVRKLGIELGIAENMVWRQPFPGPGLAIRIIGDVTDEKLEIVRESDAILHEEIANAGLNREIWQYFTVLTNNKSVGVMGDFRTYDYTLAIRAVTAIDGMTADFAKIPWEVLQKISVRIVNEVKGINRIVYDITSKPPSTIEWE